jgi:two-component system, NtrC family, C4-dicarboxylate transport sensor histidine kinase DctB
MRMLRPLGIRGRLFWAFGSVAAMTMVASFVAWISFGGVGDSLNRIVTNNIPTVMLAARLAEKGGVITATAPTLAAALNEADRAQAWTTLTKNLEAMSALLEQVDAPLVDSDAKSALHAIINALAANLRALDTNVRRQFWFRGRNEELINRLRWAHADFLDEVEPMVKDAKFNIGLAVERSIGESDPTAMRNQEQTLRLETGKQAALLRLSAAGNLAVGLIARAASLARDEALTDTALFLTEVQGRIRTDIDAIELLPEALSLRQSLQDLMAFAEGPNNLFQLRRDELKTLADGHKLVTLNRQMVSKLQSLITQRVEAGNVTSLAAAHQSESSIERGKLLLLTAAGFSLAVAVLVVWLYVGRNLVRRITLLDGSMRAIAAGDLDTEVPTGGADEISEMAAALSTFRDTLAETQAELIQAGKLAALGQLSAGVAHELNQPLAAIRSYAHNASRLIDKGNVDEAASTLTRISKLVERMGGTVNHLRTLARRPSAQLERVDLATVSDDALKLLDGRIRDKNIVVSNTLQPGQWIVSAEAIRLEQVLINLIGNAVDAMVNQPERNLSIAAESAGGKVSLNISDSGTGISEDDLQRIFDPFFTTKEVGEGLGLGLAISYNIIKDFNGSIRVNNAAVKGTVFTIILMKA